MEIREPRFQKGQKVMYEGNLYIVVEISSYSFSYNEYLYRIEDDVEQCVKSEEDLEPYVEKPKTVWDLQNGDEYYYIDMCGDFDITTFGVGSCLVDKKMIEIGNAFLTKEEAEFEVERRKIETEMLNLGGRRRFEKGKANWYLEYRPMSGGIEILWSSYEIDQGVIYFESEEKAKKAVETIGKDRIKKYIFGVNK